MEHYDNDTYGLDQQDGPHVLDLHMIAGYRPYPASQKAARRHTGVPHAIIGISCSALVIFLFLFIVFGSDAYAPASGRADTVPVTPFSTRLHTLPPHPDAFVGREDDIAKLNELGSPVLIAGMGGIGKSTLALVLAHNWSSLYPDAQIFIDAQGTQRDHPTAEQLLEQVILVLNPTAHLPAHLASLQTAFRNALAGKRVLILVDNAFNASQILSIIPPVGSALIATSRRSFMLGVHAPYKLEFPSAEDSAGILHSFCPSLSSDATAELVQICGKLPLALRIVGAYLKLDSIIAGEVLSSAAFIDRLKGKHDKLVHLDASAAFTSEVTISATLRLSEDLLGDTERIAWHRISVFTTAFNARAAMNISGVSVGILERLVLLNMLERVGSERFKLHDLVAEYARTHLDNNVLSELRFKHARHYTMHNAEASVLFMTGRDKAALDMFDAERAHFEAAFSHLSAAATSGDGATSEKATHMLLDLLHAVSFTADMRLPLRTQVIPWLTAILQSSRESGDAASEGIILSYLGLAHAALGDAQVAMGFHESALSINRALNNTSGEADNLGNLALLFESIGYSKKAIPFGLQARALHMKIGNRRGEGNDHGNLGNAYFALGNTQLAKTYYKKALDLFTEIGYRRGEGNALSNLGLVESGIFETVTAGFYELGPEMEQRTARPSSASSYAPLLHGTGNELAIFEAALSIHLDIGNSRAAGYTYCNTGASYADAGQTRLAIGYYERALTIARDIGNRIGEANARTHLGVAHGRLGDSQLAISLFEASLTIDRSVGNKRGEAITLWRYANELLQSGDKRGHWQAPRMLAQALFIMQEIEFPMVWSVRQALGAWRSEVYGTNATTSKCDAPF